MNYYNEKQLLVKPRHGVVREYVSSSQQRILISFDSKAGEKFINLEINEMITLLFFLLTGRNILKDLDKKKEVRSVFKVVGRNSFKCERFANKNAWLQNAFRNSVKINIRRSVKMTLQEVTLETASRAILQELPKLMLEAKSKLILK